MTDQPDKGPPSVITLAVSVLTHVLLLAPVIYIVSLAFEKYSFFSWHPICMSIGVGLLISEAVFSISGEAFLSSKVARKTRVTIHWVLHTCGLTLLYIGLIIIVVNKNRANKYHFVTNHAKLGLSSIVLATATAFFGILANNARWYYTHIRPVLVKIAHAYGGIAMTILLLATVINGTYSHWWPGSDVGRSLAFTSFFIAGFFILVKPVLGAVSRTRVILGPPSAQT